MMGFKTRLWLYLYMMLVISKQKNLHLKLKLLQIFYSFIKHWGFISLQKKNKKCFSRSLKEIRSKHLIYLVGIGNQFLQSFHFLVDLAPPPLQNFRFLVIKISKGFAFQIKNIKKDKRENLFRQVVKLCINVSLQQISLFSSISL